jgi:hypothetical protein
MQNQSGRIPSVLLLSILFQIIQKWGMLFPVLADAEKYAGRVREWANVAVRV